MESVGDEGDVWVEESHDVGHVDLELVSWVEQQLQPSTNTVLVRNIEKALILCLRSCGGSTAGDIKLH